MVNEATVESQAIALGQMEAFRAVLVNRTEGPVELNVVGIPTEFPVGCRLDMALYKAERLCNSAISILDPLSGAVIESFLGIVGSEAFPVTPLPYTQESRKGFPRTIIPGSKAYAVGAGGEHILIGTIGPKGETIPLANKQADDDRSDIATLKRQVDLLMAALASRVPLSDVPLPAPPLVETAEPALAGRKK